MLGTKIVTKKVIENKALLAYVAAYKGLNQRLIMRKPLMLKESEPQTKIPSHLEKQFNETLEHYYKSTLELERCCKDMQIIYTALPNSFDVVMNYANILRFSTQFDKA